MIIIAGTFRLNAERREDALAAMRDVAAATNANDAGCIQYQFAVDVADPNLVVLYERWDTAENLAAHGKAAHMAPFRAAIQGCLESREIFIYKDVVEEPLG